MLFVWTLDPHPPPHNANNIENYTFVTFYPPAKSDPPHLRYVTLEWPLINTCMLLKVTVSIIQIGNGPLGDISNTEILI